MGRKAIIFSRAAEVSCQHHVNERPSFFVCEARRMWVDVSEFQG